MRSTSALLSLALLAGCQSLHRPVESSRDQPSLLAARAALEEGSAATALSIAEGVLTAQPDNVAALTQAGDAQMALGDKLAAESSYRHALALDPRNVAARVGQAKITMRDDAKLAEAQFRAVLRDAPRDAATLIDLGVSLDLQERHTEAQGYYNAALEVNPDSGAARVDLALSYALSGKAALAESMLRDVTASSLNSPRARADFAVAQVMAGHDKQAAQTLSADLPPAEMVESLAGMQALRGDSDAKIQAAAPPE